MKGGQANAEAGVWGLLCLRPLWQVDVSGDHYRAAPPPATSAQECHLRKRLGVPSHKTRGHAGFTGSLGLPLGRHWLQLCLQGTLSTTHCCSAQAWLRLKCPLLTLHGCPAGTRLMPPHLLWDLAARAAWSCSRWGGCPAIQASDTAREKTNFFFWREARELMCANGGGGGGEKDGGWGGGIASRPMQGSVSGL